MDQRPKAFVIMPFDIEFTSIYEKLIKQSLEEAGYHVARADSFLDQENILGGVIRGITTADLVIADLTTNNPNVFYELGLCHGLEKPTVLIAQSINDVPFDLRSYKILVYETHFNKIDKLKDRLKEIGKKHRTKEIAFRSPVLDFSASESSRIETVLPIELDNPPDELIEGVEQKELLDYLVEAETASHDLTSVLTKLMNDNQVVTNRITRHSTNLQALSNNPTAGSAGKFHKISLLTASDINNFSKKVEDVLPLFENTIDRLNENYSGLIGMADVETEDREGLKRLRNSMQALLDGSKEAQTSMQTYRKAVLGLGDRKLSKDLSRASRRQAEALNGILSNLQRVEAFGSKTLAMMDEKFGNKLEDEGLANA